MFEQKTHVGIFAFEDQADDEEDKQILVPEDIEDATAHPDDELQALESEIISSFDELRENGDDSMDVVATLTELAEAVEVVRTELNRRESSRQEAAAAKDELASRIHAEEGEGDGDGDGEVEAETETEPAEVEPEPTPEPAPEAQDPVAVAASGTRPAQRVPPVVKKERRINVPLSEVRRRAPAVDVPRRGSITAAADVPGFHAGAPMNTVLDIAKAIAERSRTTAITASGTVSGPKVVSIHQEFDHKVSLDSSGDEIERVLAEVTSQESLVAAGGWCAPSEIIYDFFNIAEEDGMLDLPTIGITRGGIRFPTSPSLADVFANVWLWTETDDIAAVTGSPTKPCFRPACPEFLEERLECHGVCVTAGNLTDDAYPELIANHISLTMSAHMHVMNTRHIADLVAQSTAVDVTEGANPATTASVLGAVELQVWDYRNKFGMSDNAILEAIFPSWIKGQMRSDLAKRSGVNLLDVTDADLMRWFDLRGVRVQFVQDWQVRAGDFPGQVTPRQDWPAAVSFLLYAAGTFVRGQGMTLDLGVVRDSVLNATNDHTAAWTEDCRLIAQIGHESRVVTVTTENYGGGGALAITGTGV